MVDFNAAGSAGSNEGTTNPEYLAEVRTRIDTFLRKNLTVKPSEVPSELVTALSSGLDPKISAQGSKIQVNRIAKARNIAEEKVLNLLQQNTGVSLFGCLGTEKINVLQLNIKLDQLK